MPGHLSFSSLSSYVQCGWRYYVERGLKIQGAPSWAQIGGSAVHEMTADYDLGSPESRQGLRFEGYFQEALDKQLEFNNATLVTADGDYAGPARIKESDIRATGRASKEWPNKRDKAWWLANGPAMFDRWVSWMAMNPWDLLHGVDVGDGDFLAVEFDVSSNIGDIYVKAYVDRAFVLPSGEVAVVDIKTGTMKPSDPLQLGVYAVLMEKTLGVRPSWGYYWMAEQGGTTEPVDLSRYTEDYLSWLFTSQSAGLASQVFLPQVTNMCSGCGVRDYCPAVGGRRASEIPLPTPVVVPTVEG